MLVLGLEVGLAVGDRPDQLVDFPQAVERVLAAPLARQADAGRGAAVLEQHDALAGTVAHERADAPLGGPPAGREPQGRHAGLEQLGAQLGGGVGVERVQGARRVGRAQVLEARPVDAERAPGVDEPGADDFAGDLAGPRRHLELAANGDDAPAFDDHGPVLDHVQGGDVDLLAPHEEHLSRAGPGSRGPGSTGRSERTAAVKLAIPSKALLLCGAPWRGQGWGARPRPAGPLRWPAWALASTPAGGALVARNDRRWRGPRQGALRSQTLVEPALRLAYPSPRERPERAPEDVAGKGFPASKRSWEAPLFSGDSAFGFRAGSAARGNADPRPSITDAVPTRA